VRIYESGHEVPFYQPLVSLEMLDRVLNDLDIATGKVSINASYLTEGTMNSEYTEGNATLQTEVIPKNATYNTTLNGPDPLPPSRGRKLRRGSSVKLL